jgi:hypothetical protein
MEGYHLPQASAKNTLKWILVGKLSLPQIPVCQGSEEERFCAYSRMVGYTEIIIRCHLGRKVGFSVK